MSQQFTPFIKALGAGKRAGRNLSQDEAYTAMSMILANQATPEQKGAFLMLLRVREETHDELSGFVRACRAYFSNDYTQSISSGVDNTTVDIDVACYAGKRRQLPWYILALAVMHQHQYSMVLHSTSEPECTRLYIREVFDRLGILPALETHSLAQTRKNIAATGVAYVDLQHVHPMLYEIIQLRSLFGLRSCANTLARILNPLKATHSIQGVHHHGVDEKHIQVAQAIGDQNILCFRGEGGEPEINPAVDTQLRFIKQGKAQDIQLEATQNWQIKPKSLDPNCLRRQWQNIEFDSYAQNTVISSLSAYIMLMQDISAPDAQHLASAWWRQRDTSKFFGLDMQKPSQGCSVNTSTQLVNTANTANA